MGKDFLQGDTRTRTCLHFRDVSRDFRVFEAQEWPARLWRSVRCGWCRTPRRHRPSEPRVRVEIALHNTAGNRT